MTEKDQQDLTDLAMRALDALAEYGDTAELSAACLVFEVRIPGEDEQADEFQGEFKSLRRNSPFHLSGMLKSTADYIGAPSEVEDTE